MLGLVFCAGMVWAILEEAQTLAILLLLANRLCDGLDGLLARQANLQSALGGYLDILCDMVFYISVPLALTWVEPEVRGLAAACVLASFVLTSSSFLAFASCFGEVQKTKQQEIKKAFFLR